MRRLFAPFLIAALVFLLSSCSKENVTTPSDQKEVELKVGKVALRFDKVNAPSEVSLVTATLSRAGSDTLTKNLSMYGDSTSAEMFFENIKTGLWHLKIDAKSLTNVILYSGETDIQIEDSKTTDVYLTLTPKPTGMGSVYISVKWGSSGWTDYPANPVFSSWDSPSNPIYVAQSRVLYDEGKYKMWYVNVYNNAKGDVGYAESIDGVHWHMASDKAVLTPGAAGSWDDYMVGTGAVLKDNGMYKMYYNGYRDQYGQWNIGLAVSQDGIHWEKNSSPILTASDFEEKVGAGSVIYKDGTYFLFYNYSKSNSDRAICLATSKDGLQWTKYPGNPILKPDRTWEGPGIYAPTVIYDNGQFKMVYMNYDANAFGAAVSSDGINWTKKGSEPFFKASDLKWCSRIAYSFIGKFNNEYRIYYSGGTVNGFSTGFASTTLF